MSTIRATSNRAPMRGRQARGGLPWLALAALAVLGVSHAQPLNPTFVYLLDAPVIQAGAPAFGMLDETSGQNFKDGSHHEVFLLDTTPSVAMEVTVISDAFDAYLTLYAPDGTLVTAVDDGPQGLDPVTSFVPDQDGAYLLVVSGYGPSDLGPFEVRSERLATQAPLTLTAPSRVQGFLRGSEMPDPDVGVGPSQTYLLDLDAAALLRIRGRSTSFDTVVSLFGADGFVGENDDTERGSDAELFVEVPAGRYRIIVSAWGDGSGPFALDVDRFNPVP